MTVSANDFGRVAVLMGGWAAEREVSLVSGQAVLEGLQDDFGDLEVADWAKKTSRLWERLFEGTGKEPGNSDVAKRLLFATLRGMADEINPSRNKTKKAIAEDGKVKVLPEGEIVYDTLPNGKIVAVNLPGEVEMVAVDEEDTYLRTNFSKSDNRGYRDGDPGSSRFFDRFADEQEEGSAMYNSPRHRVERDEEGNLIREYDKSNYRTTLINDEVRVYKGGSWRDRAYWLDPAQRRYLPQYMATDYIGFRCAMSRVGSKSKGKNKTVRGKKVRK